MINYLLVLLLTISLQSVKAVVVTSNGSTAGNGTRVVSSSGTTVTGRVSSGITTFLGLTDTPNSYSGADGKYVVVNGSQLEFTTGTGGVTSVGLNNGDPFTIITNSPITSSGVIAIDVVEGAIFNGSLFNGNFAELTTTSLAEGTNKYYTDERVDDRVNGLLLMGSSKLSRSYNDVSNTYTIDAVEANYTLSNIGGSVTDSQVPNNITLDNITQITSRSHTDLSNIGTNTHAQIDTHISNGDKHISHSSVVLTAGSGLTGGGNISASRTFDVATNGSIVVANDKVQLNGDTAAPGNSKYYGTNGSGVKGWLTSVAGTVTSININNGDLGLGDPSGGPITSSGTITLTTNGNLLGWAAKARPTGTVVGTTDTQTLTNKTIRNGTYNGSLLINGNTASLPPLTQGDLLFSKVASSITRLAKGTNHYALKTNGNTLAWEAISSSTPGGSNTNFQFNDNSSFGGNGALTFTKASKTLAVAADAPLDINSTTVTIADTNISLDGSSTTFTQTTGGITLTPATSNDIVVTASTGSEFKVNTNDLVVNGRTAFTGLGVTAPTAKLDVAGDIKATGQVNGSNANFTKVLASANINGKSLYATNGAALGEINIGNGGAAKAIDFNKANKFALATNANLAISASANPVGSSNINIEIRQRAGSNTVSFTACGSANGFCWSGGTAPTFTTTAGAIDIVSCWWRVTRAKYACSVLLDVK